MSPTRHDPGSGRGREGPGWFPRSLDSDRRGRRPALPRWPPRVRHRHSPRTAHHHPQGDSERALHLTIGSRAPQTGPYPPDWSRFHITRPQTLVSLVHLLVSLTEPAPSGSPGTTRLRQGGFPPDPPIPSRSGCPQLSRDRCDGPEVAVFHPHSVIKRLVAHRNNVMNFRPRRRTRTPRVRATPVPGGDRAA
jgi:hypothetical protein